MPESAEIRCEYNFFETQTDCPVEMILRGARGISDRTSCKTFFQEIKSLRGS